MRSTALIAAGFLTAILLVPAPASMALSQALPLKLGTSAPDEMRSKAVADHPAAASEGGFSPWTGLLDPATPSFDGPGRNLTDALGFFDQNSRAGSDATDEPYVSRWATDAGDLDGDGLRDVMFLETRYPEMSRTIRAVRGHDAAALWTFPLPSYNGARQPRVMGDLTGDGASDLVVVGLDLREQGAGECIAAGCFGAELAEYSWHVFLISGRDAVPVWERTYAGRLTWEGGSASAGAVAAFANAGESTYHATNATMDVAPGADYDQDGRPDVIVNTRDLAGTHGRAFAFTILAWDGTTARAAVTSTWAEVLSGDDGKKLFGQRATTGPHGYFDYVELAPAGQAVGSNTPDLAWISSATLGPADLCLFTPATWVCPGFYSPGQRGAITATLIDGETFEEAWRAPVLDVRAERIFLDAAGTDLTGDGSADFLFVEMREEKGVSFGVMSGRDGSIEWTVDRAEGAFKQSSTLDVVSGGPAPRLAFVTYNPTFWTAKRLDFTVEIINGTNGKTLAASEHSFDPEPIWAGAPDSGKAVGYMVGWMGGGMGDTDGDGTLDLALNGFIFAFHEAGTAWYLGGLIASGADGHALVSFEGDTYVSMHVVGDLDGDRLDDVLAWADLGGNETERTTALSAIRTVDSQSLWTSRLRHSDLNVDRAPGVTHSDLTDILVEVETRANETATKRFELWSGLDGHVVWRAVEVNDTFVVELFAPPSAQESGLDQSTDLPASSALAGTVGALVTMLWVRGSRRRV